MVTVTTKSVRSGEERRYVSEVRDSSIFTPASSEVAVNYVRLMVARYMFSREGYLREAISKMIATKGEVTTEECGGNCFDNEHISVEEGE
jgi:hypothetical protein